LYLLDTNSLIYFFRGQGNVASRILATPPVELAVPAIVIYELEVGIARSSSPQKRLGQLREVLQYMRILPFEASAAREAARIRVQLEATGQPIGPMDVLIAGTTLAHAAVLVTRNEKEFNRIPQLRTENWY